MDPVARLEALESIRLLKARYFRCLDTKDWDGFAEIFTPDAVMDMTSEGAPVTTGNREIAAFVKGAVGDVTTVHHGHTPEIDLTSPTTATGIWAMEDKLRWPDDSPMGSMHGYGHYHETYEKVDGEWRIKTLELRRLRLDFES